MTLAEFFGFRPKEGMTIQEYQKHNRRVRYNFMIAVTIPLNVYLLYQMAVFFGWF